MCHVNLRAAGDGISGYRRASVGRLLSSSRRTRRQPATRPTTSVENVGAVNRTVIRPPEHAHEGESELQRSNRVRTVLWYVLYLLDVQLI